MMRDFLETFRSFMGDARQSAEDAIELAYDAGFEEGERQTVEKIVAWLGRNRDDLERCLVAYDIEAGEWK